MSGGFVKIYGSILDSSIWSTDLATRVVWVSLLAMADRKGFVSASIDGIARRANVTESQAEGALQELQLPDPKSKSRANSGRRVRRVDGGWLILNYAKYRELQTESQIQAAERARRYRERNKESVTDNAHHAPSQQKTPEAEAKADTTTTPPTPSAPDGAVPKKPAKRSRSAALPPYDQLFEEAFATYPRRDGSKTGAWRQWLKRVTEGVDPLVMVAGTVGYSQQCKREQREPRFIKHAQTFFGPDRHFEADFGPVVEPPLVDEWGCITPYGERVIRPVGSKPMLVA